MIDKEPRSKLSRLQLHLLFSEISEPLFRAPRLPRPPLSTSGAVVVTVAVAVQATGAPKATPDAAAPEAGHLARPKGGGSRVPQRPGLLEVLLPNHNHNHFRLRRWCGLRSRSRSRIASCAHRRRSSCSTSGPTTAPSAPPAFISACVSVPVAPAAQAHPLGRRGASVHYRFSHSVD